MTGNNRKAKANIARIEAASARFTRWLDYYVRKITWIVEGKIGGAQFRRDRWLKSQADKEARTKAEAQVAHAHKRAEQMRGLTAEQRSVASVLLGRQEETLVRRRQVEGWARTPERAQERDRGHERGRDRGRVREG